MKTVIYLDVLLLVNFLLAWFLLRGTALITGAPQKNGRLALGSVLAALSTLVLLVPAMPWWAQAGYKAAGSLVIVWAAYSFSGWRSLCKRAAWYFLLNLALAGAVFLAVYAVGPAGMQTNNLAVYFDISPWTLLLCVLCVWLGLRLVNLLFAPPTSDQAVEAELEWEGKSLRFSALADTGCRLSDPLTGQPVLLLSLPALEKQMPLQAVRAAQLYFSGTVPDAPGGMRLVSCQTPAGPCVIPAFSAQKIRFGRGGRNTQREHVTVGLVNTRFQPGDKEALVGADWLEQLG